MDFKFDDKGLVCAIAQDVYTGEVLMQAYMNKEAIDKTISTGIAHYYSRSRQCLWKKGETSGHIQKVKKILCDCDSDCLLLLIEQVGAACHTGNRSCFFTQLKEFEFVPDYKVVFEDVETIRARHSNPVEGSYTNYLFDKGVEKICKKVGEEATETVIAAVAGKKNELVGELSDLLYHCLVLAQASGITIQDVFQEVMARKGKAPNPKYGEDNIATNTDKIKGEK
ncbi:MAG: bifunctional phosphoribosyl-AMP cyclohydrolase/phosphoribosyl-ATP diphosphatase HisIE [Clostridia bacterium]|jgi:phosphoribosyl-ATP pyrophosphohydrolase/phosphoribosyl-AMP cyclohydrolase|nr:bifunctional phosphoribosyl-AMP cyclohydrolase/phosphoribosyl-ATP diphosphatase HisIE [Clostridia bacterium]MCI9290412.1 bifunctional phosphoribosyl-AMP cyclohydrolase/phosphoribosyl-ATP diphosphatase HisIE [Clostridia bacterium]